MGIRFSILLAGRPARTDFVSFDFSKSLAALSAAAFVLMDYQLKHGVHEVFRNEALDVVSLD
jgi:hypothetical protein